MRIIKNKLVKMKASIITILFVFGFAVNILVAQPQVVIKGLKQKYPTAKNIEWTKEDNILWRAEFLLGGRKTSAKFDPEGHWLSAQQEIELDEIGVEEVRTAIKKDFSACRIISIKINNWAGYGTSYDVVGLCGTENKELSYDSNGWHLPPKITQFLAHSKTSRC
jgi:hypothetical protein